MAKFQSEEVGRNLREIAHCLKSGNLILSPFENPIEEERRGDPDQSDDNSNYFGKEQVCDAVEVLPGGKKSVQNAANKSRFRFFLDGSIRTKYVGEFIEGGLSFPLIVSEVAVAVMQRKDRKIVPFMVDKKIYFVFPKKDSALISDTTYENLKSVQAKLNSSSSILRIDFLEKDSDIRDIRTALLGRVRYLMHEMEHQLAKQVFQNANKEDWLIMDGAIRKEEFLNLDNTIGLAKSFSRIPLFAIGGKTMSLPSYLSNLNAPGDRSAVFKIADPSNDSSSSPKSFDSVLKNVRFWYIRLRNFPPMEPLGGLVKIDIKAPLEEGPDFVQLVDELSSEIYSMKLPSVYPWPRWPSYVYPIRMAEVYMSSLFLSNFVLGQYGTTLKALLRSEQA